MIGVPMLLEIVGWLGAALLLAAYGFVSYGLVDARGRTYQALNILGSLLIGVNSLWHGAWPSAALNIIWICIAVGALAVAGAQGRAAPDRTNPRA